jgi:hypothetical protein
MASGEPGRLKTCSVLRSTPKGDCGSPPKPALVARRRRAGGFYEGKDGLPWNDFTGISAGADGEVWFTTHSVSFDSTGKSGNTAKGPRWLPNDDVAQAAVDAQGNAWFATAAGIGCLERRPMTLAEKRSSTSRRLSAISNARHSDTSPRRRCAGRGTRQARIPRMMITTDCGPPCTGQGECFAYGATKDPKAKERAKKAFEALRFLQKVTQGGAHTPPKGYIARCIRPVDWPDPNVGRIEGDRQAQQTTSCGKSMNPGGPRAPTANGTGNPTPAATNWTAIIFSTRSITICAPTRRPNASAFVKSCAM